MHENLIKRCESYPSQRIFDEWPSWFVRLYLLNLSLFQLLSEAKNPDFLPSAKDYYNIIPFQQFEVLDSAFGVEVGSESRNMEFLPDECFDIRDLLWCQRARHSFLWVMARRVVFRYGIFSKRIQRPDFKEAAFIQKVTNVFYCCCIPCHVYCNCQLSVVSHFFVLTHWRLFFYPTVLLLTHEQINTCALSADEAWMPLFQQTALRKIPIGVGLGLEIISLFFLEHIVLYYGIMTWS